MLKYCIPTKDSENENCKKKVLSSLDLVLNEVTPAWLVGKVIAIPFKMQHCIDKGVCLYFDPCSCYSVMVMPMSLNTNCGRKDKAACNKCLFNNLCLESDLTSAHCPIFVSL